MESSEFTIYVCGRSWILERPADLESLWNKIAESDEPDANYTADLSADFAQDERLPYWVELWPSSIALAKWLEQVKTRLQGKQCLDLGCGLGLTAMVASSFGANVLAIDYEQVALQYAQKSAARNAVPQPTWTVMDWRKPTLPKHSIDYLWAGDIMYERCFAEPVLRFLHHSLAVNGVAWVAEPGRSVYHHLQNSLHEYSLVSRPVYTDKIGTAYAQPVPITVTVWEISRAESSRIQMQGS